MNWETVAVQGMFKGYRIEVYQGNDGTWSASIYRGGNMTARARSQKTYDSMLRAKKVGKKLVLIDRKRGIVES